MSTNPQISTLRLMVRGAYGLQKLRIQAGLRLCANFRARLVGDNAEAIEGEAVEEELSEEALKVIDKLKESYARLTDGVARNRTLPKAEGFTGDGVISDFSELVLVSQYLSIEREERSQFRQMANVLEGMPIYSTYLLHQRGIGPAMAAVLLTYFDINKATNVSKMWAYAGLDVAPDGFARSRRKEHLIEREYVAKDGATKTKLSTTYEPWLHSRLLGAFAVSLMRSKSDWRKFYDDYKHRKETDPNVTKTTAAEKKKRREAGEDVGHLWTPGRIHRASLRYMVKMFIADFWDKWRKLEGLPTRPTYLEEYLGHKHTA